MITRIRLRAGCLVVVIAVTIALLAVPTVGPSTAAPAPSCGTNTDLNGLVGEAHPVILVHGWSGSPMSDSRTLLEQLPGHDGRQYLLFDYSGASTAWPDRSEIAVCLARYIQQVSDTHRKRGGDGMVYLVAHSMGGLAIRFALDPSYGGIDGLADRVGGVVTLDTPYLGSMWGSSFYAWAKSALTDHRLFPSPEAAAWHCLAGGPRLVFPSDCAPPPALSDEVPLFQIGGDVRLHRTLFGFSAYDIDLASDGIVDLTSEWGSTGADGKPVATQVGSTAVPCTVDSGDIAVSPLGFWGTIASDNYVIDLYQGRHNANDAKALAVLPTLIQILYAASCSHVTITGSSDALGVVDTQLAAMIRHQEGLFSAHDLLNVPVPASCRHPAGRLRGFKRDWGADENGAGYGGTQLLVEQAIFGDVTRDGRSDAVVPMLCNAGGVSWPELLLVYGPGARLLGSYDLGEIDSPQEHEDITSLKARDGGIDVTFTSYGGAGSAPSTYRGRLTAADGRVAFDYDGPLTIDYAADDHWGAFSGGLGLGPGVVSGPDDGGIWLTPAPNDFTTFIQSEWEATDAAAPDCSATVVVDRYSHLGYATGSEGGCGGAAYLWQRSDDGWRTMLGYQEGPFCEDAADGTDLRAALTALGMSCYPTDGGPEQVLGDWPSSGE